MEWDYSTPHTWQHSRLNQRIAKAQCVNAIDKAGDFIFTINHAKDLRKTKKQSATPHQFTQIF
jgi:hypothetical protein